MNVVRVLPMLCSQQPLQQLAGIFKLDMNLCNVGLNDTIMFGGILVENILKLLLLQPAPSFCFVTLF